MDHSHSQYKFTFVINFYGENILSRCVNSIKGFYPDSEVIVISDEKTNLKSLKNGGKWALRYLNEFIKSDGDVLIKMDPDSLMLRRFNYIPNCDYFGYLFCGQYIHGGCKGFFRNYAERIIDSGILLSSEYTDSKYKRGIGDQVSDDLVCMDVARKLNANVIDWDEVSSMPHKSKFAVTHGHKN